MRCFLFGISHWLLFVINNETFQCQIYTCHICTHSAFVFVLISIHMQEVKSAAASVCDRSPVTVEKRFFPLSF